MPEIKDKKSKSEALRAILKSVFGPSPEKKKKRKKSEITKVSRDGKIIKE